jgi:ketosteroid isomerase-like protein
VTPQAAGEARVERFVERLRRASERFDTIAEQRRRAGEYALGPEQREELRRFVAEVWHEDCEWLPLIGGVEGATSYRGREGVLAFYEDFWGTFEVTYSKPEFRPVGDSVVHLTSMHLRARESGVELTRELGIVYELEGDLIRRGRAYDSHVAALAATGAPDA